MKLHNRLILVLCALVGLFMTYQNCGNSPMPPANEKANNGSNDVDDNKNEEDQIDYLSGASGGGSSLACSATGCAGADAGGSDAGDVDVEIDPNSCAGTNCPGTVVSTTPPANTKFFRLNAVWGKSSPELTREDSVRFVIQDDFVSNTNTPYDWYFIPHGTTKGLRLKDASGQNITGNSTTIQIRIGMQGRYFVTPGGNKTRKSEYNRVYYEENYQARLLLSYLKSVINNATAWNKIKETNSSLACIDGTADCKHNSVRLISNLYNSSNAQIFDWEVANNGFRLTGTNCAEYSNVNGAGHAYCTFRPYITAKYVCASNAATCEKPAKLTFKIQLYYDSNNENDAGPAASSMVLTFDKTTKI